MQVRIERLAGGNPGDCKMVGEAVAELRIDYGPGYRVYFKRVGQQIIVLLAGGDKAPRTWISRRHCAWRAISRSHHEESRHYPV